MATGSNDISNSPNWSTTEVTLHPVISPFTQKSSCASTEVPPGSCIEVAPGACTEGPEELRESKEF
jgi:hypothetical protein